MYGVIRKIIYTLIYFFDFTPHFQAQISAVLITFLMALMLEVEQK